MRSTPMLLMMLVFTLVAQTGCKKQYGIAPYEIRRDSIKLGTLDMQFVDETTGMPIPELEVQFVEQWATFTTLFNAQAKTDQLGRISLRNYLDKNLLISLPAEKKDSSYFLLDGILDIVPAPVPIPRSWRQAGPFRFFPYESTLNRKAYKVTVPQSAAIRINYVQDSIYQTTMQNSYFVLVGQVFLLEQGDAVSQFLGRFSQILEQPSTRISGTFDFPVYANRKYRVVWIFQESERVLSYNDDGNSREIIQGEFIIENAIARQVNALTLHY